MKTVLQVLELPRVAIPENTYFKNIPSFFVIEKEHSFQCYHCDSMLFFKRISKRNFSSVGYFVVIYYAFYQNMQ